MVVVYVGTGLGILELKKENLDWVFIFNRGRVNVELSSIRLFSILEWKK